MRLSLAWKWLVTALFIEGVMLFILVYRNVEQLSENLLTQTNIRLQAEKALLQSALIAPYLQNDYATIQAILEESYVKLNMLYLVALDIDGLPVASIGLVNPEALPTPNTQHELNKISIQNAAYNSTIDITIDQQKIGSILVGVSTEFYQQERRSMMAKSIGIALLELLLSAFILNLLARWINKNLLKLTQSAQAIAEGNYTQRVELSHDKEISKLATAFNAMATSIQERIVSLEQMHTKEQMLAKELEFNAYYDTLTRLPNRVLLADRLLQALRQADRKQHLVAVIYLDLDGFKNVNDTYGHYVGDQLLISLAQKMQSVLREEDTLARMGGDEFVIVLHTLDEAYSCQIILERLLKIVAEPVNIDEHTLFVSCSIGVTMYPMDYQDGEQLIRHADQAMYIAKQSGKNRYHIFDFNENALLKLAHGEIRAIAEGLKNHEFVLYYQPKVNMRTGRIVGVEALIRWMHPTKGLLLPMSFIPLIERHPLMIKLGEWVISQALWQIQAWNQQNIHLPISINISAYQLQESNFLDRLKILLEDYTDIHPHQLEIEILETSALEEIERISYLIKACDELGVRFSLDDFGTGYSTLMHLKKLPAKILKMDKSFIGDMIRNPDDLTIVEGVIGLARSFHKYVIAEGVETVEHGIFLLLQGCEYAQGYGIAKPMPVDTLLAWMQNPESLRANLHVWQHYTHHTPSLPWLYALAEHNAWLHALKAYVNEESLLFPELDPDMCRFGQWINHEIRITYHEETWFMNIDSLHQRLHKLSSKVLHYLSLQQKSAIYPLMDTIESVHEKLTQLIYAHLKAEVRAFTQAKPLTELPLNHHAS